MEEQKIITGTKQEIWDTIERDLTVDGEVLGYDALLDDGQHRVALYIDIDLGGGFEGGSALTRITSPLHVSPGFRFALHDEDFLDSIGKFFGLEDVVTGYPELDDHVVIKTNAREKLVELFADDEVRRVLTGLEDFDLGIHHRTVDDVEYPFLELNINDGVTDPAYLHSIFNVFYKLIDGLEK